MKCPFCNLDNRKILRETANTLTLLSNPYLLKGHCLIIPKKHYENILEVPEEVLIELIREAREVERILLNKFKTGCDIRQHYRPFQNQNKLKVDHLHIHIIPRELKDELYEKRVFKELDKKTEAEVSKIFLK